MDSTLIYLFSIQFMLISLNWEFGNYFDAYVRIFNNLMDSPRHKLPMSMIRFDQPPKFFERLDHPLKKVERLDHHPIKMERFD